MTIVAIAGAIFAVYTWLDGKASRDIKYVLSPNRATVVEYGRTSNLEVLFQNKRVENDISAAQVIVWNAGKLPVRTDDILQPLVLRTADSTPILEAKIRNPGREVSKFTIDTSQIDKGLVSINWKILETNDGAVVQIIYAVGPGVGISVDGIVEGQAKITQVAHDPLLFRPRPAPVIIQILLVCLGSVLVFFMVRATFRQEINLEKIKNSRRRIQIQFASRLSQLTFILIFLAVPVYLIWKILSQENPVPFNFE